MRKIYRSLALLLSLAVLALSSCQPDSNELIDDAEAIGSNGDVIGTVVPGRYIVVYNPDKINTSQFRMIQDYDAKQSLMTEMNQQFLTEVSISPDKMGFVYTDALQGFAAELTDLEVDRLRRDPRVAYIEPDAVMSIYTTTQTNATWGLDRIDQRALPLNGTYTYEANGSGVTAYIIDTGVRTDHVEFGGRALRGFDAFGGTSEDCNGHGTHVGGTVGGTLYGVAKNVTLVGVRVLDCNGSGTTSGVVAGMDWVAANASGASVANMSLGGGGSVAIDDAVTRMFNAGVPVIVAAGNGDRLGRQQDACNSSPARAANAYTVGATTNTDAKTSWSNFGNCVDIFAPGASITAAWHTSSTATNTISGTSMASPHVAGVAALFLQNNPSASPQQVYNFLTNNSTKNIVTNSSTTNNHLLYSLTGDSSGGGDNGGGDNGGGDDGSGDDGSGDDGDASITLSGSGTKVQGRWRSSLTWSGASSSQVDIFRNGTKIATVNNSGSYVDQTDFRGGGSLTYTVCEAGSSTCSNSVTINF